MWTKRTLVRSRRWASAVAAPEAGVRGVEPDETAGRECGAHEVDRVAGSAADVGDVDARPEALDEAGHQRQGDLDEGGVVDGAAVLGHQGLKSRERGIPDAAAVAEAAQDVVFDLGEQPDVLGLQGEVVRAGGAGQPRGVRGRQREGHRRRVVVDDASGGHRRQPFPHVAFVQPGDLGDPFAGGRRQCGHRVEQAATVTNADHQRQHAGVHHVQQPLGELRRSGQARLFGHGQPPSTPATRRPPRRPEKRFNASENLRSNGGSRAACHLVPMFV